MKTLKNLLLVLQFFFLLGCNGTNKKGIDTPAIINERILSILNETRTNQYFSDDSVSAEDIIVILEAGRNATSGRNMQPWYFAAIINHEIIKDIAGKMTMGPSPGFKDAQKGTHRPSSAFPKAQFADAPAAIALACKSNSSFNLGLACENMIIAATTLGYGSKIVGSGASQLNTPENKALLEIPEGMNVEVILLIGKPDTTIDMTVDGVTGASVRKPLNEVSKIIK